jgi:hypothetical protein
MIQNQNLQAITKCNLFFKILQKYNIFLNFQKKFEI